MDLLRSWFPPSATITPNASTSAEFIHLFVTGMGVRLIATRWPPIETPKCRSFGAALRCADQLCRSRRRWDEIVIDGDITAKGCLLKYNRKGRLLAVASIFRD